MLKNGKLFIFILVVVFLISCSVKDKNEIGVQLVKTVSLSPEIQLNTQIPKIHVNKEYVVVFDRVDSSIILLDKNGHLLDKYGEKGQAPNSFGRLQPMLVDAFENNLFISDDVLGRLSIVSIENSKLIQKNMILEQNVSVSVINKDEIWLYRFLPEGESDYIFQKLSSSLQVLDQYITFFKFYGVLDKRKVVDHSFTLFKVNGKRDVFLAHIFDGKIVKLRINDDGTYERLSSVVIPFEKKAKNYYPEPAEPGSCVIGGYYMTDSYLIVKKGYVSLDKMKNPPQKYLFYIYDFDLQLVGELSFKENINPFFTRDMHSMYYLKDNQIFEYLIEKFESM